MWYRTPLYEYSSNNISQANYTIWLNVLKLFYKILFPLKILFLSSLNTMVKLGLRSPRQLCYIDRIYYLNGDPNCSVSFEPEVALLVSFGG